jgi:hypothetical protein
MLKKIIISMLLKMNAAFKRFFPTINNMAGSLLKGKLDDTLRWEGNGRI